MTSPFAASLPYATPVHLAIGGRLKCEPDDFRVEEIPAYLPCGEGQHLFLLVEKRDLPAEGLVGHLSRTLGIHREEIGVAGLKDRRAITRQWVSVPMEVADRLDNVASDQVSVLEFGLHRNKLKTGHLLGNRFHIVVRQAAPDAVATAQQIAEIVQQQGVPNYFGEQRFGFDGETLKLGMAILKGEQTPQDIPINRRKFLTRLALSAAQSALFNAVLSQRLNDGTLLRVLPGDVMQKVATGGQFVAEDLELEQPRYDRRETVVTGPIFGPKMKLPTGDVQQHEQQVLDSAGLSRELFRTHRKLTPGTRRPLVIWPDDLQVSEHSAGVEIAFTLPSGAYATIVLREFMKSDESSASGSESSPEISEAPTADTEQSSEE